MQNNNNLLEAIFKNPKNMELRLVYSDYLEEHGNLLEAEAWRWLVKEQKFPWCHMFKQIEPKWFCFSKYVDNSYGNFDLLPDEIFCLLNLGQEELKGEYCYEYEDNSHGLALLDAAQSYVKARENGWTLKN